MDEPFILEVYQSDVTELYVEAESNLISYIQTVTEGEKLTIGRRSNYSLSPRKEIRIRLYTDDLKSVSVANGGVAVCDTFVVDNLELYLYGTSRIIGRCITTSQLLYYSEGGTLASIHGYFNKLEVKQVGSAETFFTGQADNFSVIQEGSGKVESYDLNATHVNIQLFGSGLIFCRAISSLNVLINGKGRVYYRGSPSLTTEIEGEGLLVREGN